MANRRVFLNLLAASPLFAGLAWRNPAWAQDDLIASAADALDVFDFEAVARQVLPPAHWGYMATGVDGDVTLRANREGFDRYQLRVRRLVDVSSIKELARRWYPGVVAPPKQESHRALDDIRESIAELRFYRERLFVRGTEGSRPSPPASAG